MCVEVSFNEWHVRDEHEVFLSHRSFIAYLIFIFHEGIAGNGYHPLIN